MQKWQVGRVVVEEEDGEVQQQRVPLPPHIRGPQPYPQQGCHGGGVRAKGVDAPRQETLLMGGRENED